MEELAFFVELITTAVITSYVHLQTDCCGLSAAPDNGYVFMFTFMYIKKANHRRFGTKDSISGAHQLLRHGLVEGHGHRVWQGGHPLRQRIRRP